MSIRRKYRKKPVVVEAEQWFSLEDAIKGVERFPQFSFTQPDGKCEACGSHFIFHGWIETLEGGHTVCPGDWIITGVKGEKYPCKPDVFEQIYEPIEEEKP